MPARMKKSGRKKLTSSLRVAGSFFCCSYTAARVVPGSLILNVSTWTWPCAEDQRVPTLALTLVRHLLGRKSDARAGDGIVDHAPADQRLLGFRRGGEQGAFLRVQDAGFLQLAIALERLDGGRGLVVDLAIDQAVVVARPGEIELNGHAVGQGHAGVARRFRWRPLSRCRCRQPELACAVCRARGCLGRRLRALYGETAAQGGRTNGGVAELAGLRGRFRRYACWRNGVIGSGRRRAARRGEERERHLGPASERLRGKNSSTQI